MSWLEDAAKEGHEPEMQPQEIERPTDTGPGKLVETETEE